MEFDSSKKSFFPTKMIKVQRKETMKNFWITHFKFSGNYPLSIRPFKSMKKFEIRFIFC